MSGDPYYSRDDGDNFEWQRGVDTYTGGNVGRLVAIGANGLIAADLLPPTATGVTVSVLDFGAVADGVSECLLAFQAAHDALPAYGGTIIVPAGLYKITGTINVTKCCVWQGNAPADSGSQGCRIFENTATTVLFAVATIYPVYFRSLVLINSTGGTAIRFVGTATNNSNPRSLVEDCAILFGANGLDFVAATTWAVKKCLLVSQTNNAISVQDTESVTEDSGDSTIEGCVINIPTGQAGIYWKGSGGLRIVNNKLLNGVAGINLFPDPAVVTGVVVIDGNSIENQSYGIIMQSTGGVAIRVTICSNEIAGQSVNCILCSSANIKTVNINANSFGPAANLNHISFTGVYGAIVDGNIFAGTGGAAVNIGAGASYVRQGANLVLGGPKELISASATTTITGLPTLAFADLPTCANGSVVYCSDGTAANPVAGSGTGCIAKRLNGAWVGN